MNKKQLKLVAAVVLSLILLTTPTLAFDYKANEGKRLSVKRPNGGTLYSGTIKKCSRSKSGYCVGTRPINQRGEVLGWSGYGDYQWGKLHGGGKYELQYLDKNGKRKRRSRWFTYTVK